MPVLKNVEHNSQNEFYRSPVGAAESYTDVRLRIKLELDDIEDQKAEISVKARFWRERVGTGLCAGARGSCRQRDVFLCQYCYAREGLPFVVLFCYQHKRPYLVLWQQ